MRTRSAAVVTAVLFLLLGLSGCGDTEEAAETDSGGDNASASGTGATCEYPDTGRQPAKEVDPPPAEPAYDGEVSATITTNRGDIPITLSAGETPCTVNSFLSLAEQGYFADSPCHRLTTGGSLKVLQCGDPTGTGTGGPGYSFADELSNLDTTKPVVDYPAGTLAMANAGPDTNGSQFFMVYADSQLPPAYTVFGSIGQAGLQVLQQVAAAGSDSSYAPGDGRPDKSVTIESVQVQQ